MLPLPPSRWYLGGLLAPTSARDPQDPTADEDLSAGADADDEDGGAEEAAPKQRHRFPASLGMSVLLPPAEGDADDAVRATVRFADYMPEPCARDEVGDGTEADDGPTKRAWRRTARAPEPIDIPLRPAAVAAGIDVPQTHGMRLEGRLETTSAPGLAPGTRALSLFLVNRRQPLGGGDADAQFAFQVHLALEYHDGFAARQNRSREASEDWDERVAGLQYRDHHEYAVGHGVSVAGSDAGDGAVRRVETCWLPRHEVRRVVTHAEPAVETSMDALAELADGTAAAAALAPLTDAYLAWLEQQMALALDSPRRADVRNQLMADARQAAARIRAGIARLQAEPDMLDVTGPATPY